MIVSVFKPNVASENPLDTSSLFDLNFTSQNISSSTSNVVKSFSHGYKLDSNFVNDRYYIGQYNCYYSPEYKTSYLAKVNYENMSSTVEKQNLKTVFTTRLANLSNTLNADFKTIIFYEYDVIEFDDTMENIVFTGGNQIAFYSFPVSGFYDIIFLARDSYTIIKVYCNNQLVYDFTVSAQVDNKFCYFFETGKEYKFVFTSPSSSVLYFDFNMSDLQQLQVSSTITHSYIAKNSEVFEFTVSQTGFYSINAVGGDPNITLYKEETKIAYNDDDTYLDEEGNEEYNPNSYLFMYLESGYTYYLVVYNGTFTTTSISISII